ncbi:MAG TPA: TolC family protein [Desulfuromonadaceae bacterium]
MKNRRASLLVLVLCLFTTPAWAGTLTLEECLARAQRDNPTLKAAAWDTRVAEENVRLASSARYPRMDAEGGYTMQQAPQGMNFQGLSIATQQPDYAFGSLAATYTIYDFGRRNARVQQARALADSTSHTFAARRNDVALLVIEAYFGILEAGRLVSAADEEVTQLEQHLQVAQALFEEGAVTRNDVLQADVRLAASRQNLLAARNRRENAWLQLDFLIGAEQGFRGELNENAAIVTSTGIRPDDRSLLARRPEIQALHKAIEANEAEVKESGSNFYPELYTRLGLDYVQNDKVTEQTIMSATIGLKMNLFDGFATSATRERAVRSRSRNQDTLRQTESQVQLEIATAQNDMRVARERIGVTEAAIRQSEENLRINHERYKERVGTATEVLDAQTLLTQTRTDYYRALFDYQVASARLKRAIGEL